MSGNFTVTYRKSVLYLKSMKREAASSSLFQSTHSNILKANAQNIQHIQRVNKVHAVRTYSMYVALCQRVMNCNAQQYLGSDVTNIKSS